MNKKTNLTSITDKLISEKSLSGFIASLKSDGKCIGFTNGCFDILHLGHIDYLAKASDLCDVLIIGLNSDKSVTNLKGKSRPINNYIARSKMLASLFFIDAVIEFDEETPFNLISSIVPDLLIKGGDYKIEEIIGYDIVKMNGGKTLTIDLVSGYSTSKIENQIRKL